MIAASHCAGSSAKSSRASLAAIAFTLAATCLFAILSVRFMPVGEFVAIVMLVPVIVTLISATLFQERVRPTQWLFLLVGFAGVMLIIEPAQPRFGWNTLLPLACVVASVAYQLSPSVRFVRKPATSTNSYSRRGLRGDTVHVLHHLGVGGDG